MKWFDDRNPLYPPGAELSRHPFLDTQAFYGVSRRSPAFLPPDETPVTLSFPEIHCAFCMGRLKDATPDKSRTALYEGEVRRTPYPKFEFQENTLFRRQGNLFEIISFEYWRNKYGIDSSPRELMMIEEFFSDPETSEFLHELVRQKFARIRRDYEALGKTSIREAVKPFFSGFHELLSSGRHFQMGAQTKSGLFMSGNMSWQEHRISYEDIILIHKDMLARNKYIKFISTFQNWLALAGASFEHWHKQVLASDFWGKPLLRERNFYKTHPDAYARFALDTAVENNFIVAENEHALAYVEVGGKTGFITIASKSEHLQPHRHTEEEIRGMSDLVHAVCGAVGPATPYNEEWFYTPFNADDFKTPWRVMINLRNGTEAGFENINQYMVSTVSQKELAETLRANIAALPGKAPSVQACGASSTHKKSLRY